MPYLMQHQKNMRNSMFKATFPLAFIVTLITAFGLSTSAHSAEPIKVIYLTSPGIYHDYALQTDAITSAIASRVNVTFDISLAEKARWKNTDYARGYDLIIYNICDADNTDSAQIANMRRQSEELKIPAMLIHCSMHSFRTTDEWWPLYDLKTVAHEAIDAMPQQHAAAHPILMDIPKDWSLESDELYINLAFDAEPLLTSPADNGEAHVTAWTSNANGTRIFGTTLGHSEETIGDPVFQQLLGNALLWATDNLSDDGSFPAALMPNPNTSAISAFSSSEGARYLTADERGCMRLEMGKAVGLCYLGCILNPFIWGAKADACRADCNEGIPSTSELLQACSEG
jgi:hypothetical protein